MNTWEVVKNDLGLLHVDVGAHNVVLTATRSEYSVGLTPEQAYLVAAAPSLLAACEAARAALAPLPGLVGPWYGLWAAVADAYAGLEAAIAKAKGDA